MIVYIENTPVMKSENSQIIHGVAEDFTIMSDADFESFETAESLDEIKDRLRGMDEMGVHIANDEGVVYRSARLADIVDMLEATMQPALFTTLTRQYELRKAVLNMIREKVLAQ